MTTQAAVGETRANPAVDPIVLGIIVFFAAHALIRIFGTPDFSIDDSETVVHTQVFQLYYALRNPPLFDWLFYAFSSVLGVSNATMQILKTFILGSGGIFLYLAARPAFRHRRALEGAVAAYGATAFYGWDIFQQFTHTVAIVLGMAFTLWALMRVVRSKRSLDYVLLGIGLGVGLLSKYLFALYFLALIGAACLRPAYRPAILSWRMLLTAIVALAVLSPLIVGLALHLDGIFAYLDHRIVGSSDVGALESLGIIAILSMEFWLPFAAILLGCLALWPVSKGSVTATEPGPAAKGDESFYPFLRDATLLLVGATLASVLILRTNIGITGGRYVAPMMSLIPLSVLAWIDRAPVFPARAMDRFLRATVTLIVGVAVVRFAIFLFVAPPFCVPRCALFTDYRPVAEKLAPVDDKQTVILADTVHTGSNLLRLVPNSRVVIDYYTAGSDLGIAAPAHRRCYFVWRYRDRSPPFNAALESALRRSPTDAELAEIGPVEYVAAGWLTKLRPATTPDTPFGIAPIDSASRLCDGGRLPGLSAPPSDNSAQ